MSNRSLLRSIRGFQSNVKLYSASKRLAELEAFGEAQQLKVNASKAERLAQHKQLRGNGPANRNRAR